MASSEPPTATHPPRRRIGPRAQRRLAWTAGAIVLVIAGGAVNQLLRSGNSSLPRTAAPKRHSALGINDLDVAYGTTPKELTSRLGPPTAKETNCWIYRGKAIAAQLSADGTGAADAVKYCFSEGPTGGQVVTGTWTHYLAHTIKSGRFKGHYPAGWGNVVIQPGPIAPS